MTENPQRRHAELAHMLGVTLDPESAVASPVPLATALINQIRARMLEALPEEAEFINHVFDYPDDVEGAAVILKLPRRDALTRGEELNDLQADVAQWAGLNFPNTKPYQPLLGMQEELGELSHAHLKREQAIRFEEDHDRDIKDALGDLVIFALHYCHVNDLKLSECIEMAWEEAPTRDWAQYRKDHGIINYTGEALTGPAPAS